MAEFLHIPLLFRSTEIALEALLRLPKRVNASYRDFPYEESFRIIMDKTYWQSPCTRNVTSIILDLNAT